MSPRVTTNCVQTLKPKRLVVVVVGVGEAEEQAGKVDFWSGSSRLTSARLKFQWLDGSFAYLPSQSQPFKYNAAIGKSTTTASIFKLSARRTENHSCQASRSERDPCKDQPPRLQEVPPSLDATNRSNSAALHYN